MYRIFYWKSVKKGATNPIVILDPNDSNCDNTASINNGEEFCIRNDLCSLKKEDTGILHSQSTWLNDRIMDAAQKLIFETLGKERSYHSVLNTQRKVGILFRPVNQDHIQLLHGGSSCWFLRFCSSGQMQICNSLMSSLNRVSWKSGYELHKNVVGGFGKVTLTSA